MSLKVLVELLPIRGSESDSQDHLLYVQVEKLRLRLRWQLSEPPHHHPIEQDHQLRGQNLRLPNRRRLHRINLQVEPQVGLLDRQHRFRPHQLTTKTSDFEMKGKLILI